jgi:pimeloyl-ACP methyl ester carboxylesterase
MTSYVAHGSKAIMRGVVLIIFFGLASLCFSVVTPESARLKEPMSVELGGSKVFLSAGTLVQVINKNDVSAVVSLHVNGDPLITQIRLEELEFVMPRVANAASLLPSEKEARSSDPKNRVSVVPMVQDRPNLVEAPTSISADLSDDEDESDVLPDFNTTLSPQDVEMPQTRFTALNGYFYIVINGAAIPVVYSLPMEGDHLAPSASNLIFYGPYPNEQTQLKGNIVPNLVTKLGCSVFSLSFSMHGDDLDNPKIAYWSKESGWFKAVMDARQEIIRGFGLHKEKLLLMGYSGGGGMVLNLTGAFPDEVEAVVAQAANLVPEIGQSNSVKWLIINNRGENNAGVTLPFYQMLKQKGCTALYCETTPSRGRGQYHAPSGEAYDLMYTFLAGIIDQRHRIEDGQTDHISLWPYASPSDPLKRYRVVRTQTLDASSGDEMKFDLLPSAEFALDWSKVCPPVETVTCVVDSCRLHVNFPASAKPKGLVIYYDNPDYDTFPRQFEDICSLAEAGFVVVSPMFKMSPAKFARGASDWIVSQSKLQSLPIHLAGYGERNRTFLQID